MRCNVNSVMEYEVECNRALDVVAIVHV